MSEYIITLTWDADASVWVAVNDEIPIALEAESCDALIERVRLASPELLCLNGLPPECSLVFVAERRENIA